MTTRADFSDDLPDSWELVPFTQCLQALDFSKPRKILARDYQPDGQVPVVDQGQSFIAGWTNDVGAAIHDGLPLVVFGDHTRAFKFVDFPFALGADGTQLLKPGKDFDARFFYYACQHLSLPSRGYNRHFKMLKEQRLPRPPRREQEAIAGVLRLVEQALATEEQRITRSTELMVAVRTRLFDDPAMREFRRMSIGAVAKTSSGGTPSRARADFFGGSVPWVKSGELNDGFIDATEESITTLGLEASSAKIFPPGTLLIAMYGATVGKTAILRFPASTNQAICAVLPDPDRFDTSYLRYHLISDRDVLLGARYGGAQPNISQQIIRAHEVFLPPIKKQQEIAQRLETIDRTLIVQVRRRLVLEELFRSLLDSFMSGELRADRIAMELLGVDVK